MTPSHSQGSVPEKQRFFPGKIKERKFKEPVASAATDADMHSTRSPYRRSSSNQESSSSLGGADH